MRPYTLADAEADLRTAMTENRWDRVAHLANTLDLYDRPKSASVQGAALWYATYGIPVFPLQPGTKIPYPGSRGVKDATLNLTQIRDWWATTPTANIGLATGHQIDVIDFDGPHAHHAWSQAYGAVWETAGITPLATVTTPRPGGLHVYVAATGEGNHAAMLPGVDYRGRGGYVLAPPSQLDNRPGQHPGTYLFLRPLHL